LTTEGSLLALLRHWDCGIRVESLAHLEGCCATGQGQALQKSGLKWIGKPDSVVTRNSSHSDHSSCPLIAQGVERPYPRAMGGPPNPPIWPCSRWGLPCVHHHWRTGELLPRLFNLTRRRSAGRYVFCGTFPRSLEAVVNGHPVLWSPDFPPPPLKRRRSLDPL
jgi:hypothetical protein